MPENPSPESRRSYSTAYVAKRMGVSVPTIQRWVDSGQLLGWKTLGGHRRIDADSADKLISKHSGDAMGTAATAPSTPMNIVIVDDNPDDRDILSAIAEEAFPGATVTVADNGFLGLVAIGQTRPDVVITDIQMPMLDGIEMLKQLSLLEEVRPKLLVAVSSLTRAQLPTRGEMLDSVIYMCKPIADPAAFIGILRAGVASN